MNSTIRKGVFPYLVICFSCLTLSKIAMSQNKQQTINENDLIKNWKLESETTCDRCPDYFPKETLKLNFYANHTCNGIIEGRDTSLTGSWALDGDQLNIQYKSKSGEKKTIEYRVLGLTPNILRLMYSLTYDPENLRTFISIK